MTAHCQHLLPLHYTPSLQGRNVYKDQCSKCFDSPKTKGGIFVCLKCFNSFCPGEHLQQHLSKFHDHPLYLHIEMEETSSPEQGFELTKIAIGKEGGALGGPQYKTSYELYCGRCEVATPEYDKIQDKSVIALLQSLIGCESAYKKQSLVQWELQVNPCQHTLTLQQQPQVVDFSKCGECGLSNSLWLCLTCGHVGCARKNYDGSGGNNHGIEHYEITKHPLVVKSGTITAEGKASVHCYACGDEVQDDDLAAHLKQLGINIAEQKKTEKTILELTLDMNLHLALSRLVEDGKKMIPMYGKGFTGIDNLGNSCYMNSVLQTLFSLEEFEEVYYQKGQSHMKECLKVPNDCYYCQVGKAAVGLYSGKYSQPLIRSVVINEVPQEEEYQLCVQPFDFKVLIARNHQDFSSTLQQDALEYLQYLFDRILKEEEFIPGAHSVSNFDFVSANKLVCMGCQGVKIIENKTNEWKFPVPHPTQPQLDEFYKTLSHEEDDKLREAKKNEEPEYPTTLEKCFQMMEEGDIVEANCPKCQKLSTFRSLNLFKTTPKYLIAVANRFVMDNWSAKKLNADIQVGDSFDISRFKLANNKEGGQLLPESSEQPQGCSDANVNLIAEMGFSKNAAIRALTNNQDNVEIACSWLYQHLEDPDINAPLHNTSSTSNPPQELILQLQDFGYSSEQASAALSAHSNNIEIAANYLMEHDGDVSGLIKKSEAPKGEVGGEEYERYQLHAVIVHLGKSVHSGHYVVYIRKNGKWILYNDSRIFETEDPALGKGYIYLYKGVKKGL